MTKTQRKKAETLIAQIKDSGHMVFVTVSGEAKTSPPLFGKDGETWLKFNSHIAEIIKGA